MELSHILKTLSRRKLELALTFWAAALFALLSTHTVSLSPLDVKKRAINIGAATTQVLVDSPQSSLVDIEQETLPLSTRAAVYAQFMRSNVVRASIASQLGIPVEAIVAQGPFTTLDGRQNITRPGEVRSNEIRGEAEQYRLVFDNQQDLPIVSIYAQAPTPGRALALANASVKALQKYVESEEINQSVPPNRRTVIRELGPAEGGWVNNGVNPIFMALAFAAALAIGCFLIIVTDRPLTTLKQKRRRRKAQRQAAKPGNDANGHLLDPDDVLRVGEPPLVVRGAGYADEE